jgi:hypothetical protein
MGLHEFKKLLHNQRNGHKMEEIAYRMGENLCQLNIWQQINNQNTQGVPKIKLPKISDPMKKWSNEMHFLTLKTYVKLLTLLK